MIDLSKLEINSVINIGAGHYSEPQNDFWRQIHKATAKVALDIHDDRLKSWINTGWVPIKRNANLLDDPFIDKSFDLAMATDLIEHLDRASGFALIDQMERIAKKAVVIFTPVGFLDTEKYQKEAVGDDRTLIHRSGWDPEVFKALGYEVEIIKDLHNFGDTKFSAFWAWRVLK